MKWSGLSHSSRRASAESRSRDSLDAIAVGVAGVGNLGFHHARLLKEMSDVRLLGVHDIDAKRADQVASELETRAYAELEHLLVDVDAVIVAVPTSSHLDVGRYALEHDCDVLIEKPIATSTAEADELIRLGAEKDRVIQVGHIERFNGAVRAWEAHLDNPVFIESHRLAPFVPRGTDVPVVLDLMIHDIDLILSLIRQDVVDMRAVGVPVLSDSVDIANARLEFEGGAVANITASRVSRKRERKIRFFQASGYASLDLSQESGEFYRRKENQRDLPGVDPLNERVEHVSLRGDGQEPLRLELEAFARAVRREASVAVSAEEGRMALAIALEIVDRIKRHQDRVFDSNTART